MERGFLNAYTYDAPPRGGAPPPKRPRSARGTGEIVEEEIQPTADEEIRPTQAGPSQTTQTSSQCGPGVEGRTYKHTCDEPNVEEGATAYCEKCGRMVGGIKIGPFEYDEWHRPKVPPHPDLCGSAKMHVPVACMPILLDNDQHVLKVIANSAQLEFEVQPEVEGSDERDIVWTGRTAAIMGAYQNVYLNIRKKLEEVARNPEKRHKIPLVPYELVKPIIGLKGRNHQAIVDITGAVVKIVEEPLPGQEFEDLKPGNPGKVHAIVEGKDERCNEAIAIIYQFLSFEPTHSGIKAAFEFGAELVKRVEGGYTWDRPHFHESEEERIERQRQGFRKPTGVERQWAEQDPFGGWRLVKAKQKDPIEPGDRKKDRTIVYFFNAVTGETRDSMPPRWKYPYQNHPKPDPQAKRKEPEPSSETKKDKTKETKEQAPVVEEIMADDPPNAKTREEEEEEEEEDMEEIMADDPMET